MQVFAGTVATIWANEGSRDFSHPCSSSYLESFNRVTIRPMRLDDSSAKMRLRRKLLRWYDNNHRKLPWRETPGDAYRQWLAEVMLQQTQVATVVPYFNRFIKRFPTITQLADAPLDEVLRLWAGLGYYARGRNLHRCAQVVAGEFAGVFPQTAQELQSLPGIGRYTAGAIASIAFGQRAAVLDGNVKRVLARLFSIKASISETATLNRLWDVSEQLLPQKRVGDFNQALMELGAMVCLPKRPKCDTCPLVRECSAFADDIVDQLPKSGRRPAPVEVKMVVAAVERRGRYLIRQRDHDGLWGGMWELPSAELNGHRSSKSALSALLRRLHPLLAQVGDPHRKQCGQVSHKLTHRTIRMSVYICRSDDLTRTPRTGKNLRWVSPKNFDRYAFATAQQKVIKLVLARNG